MMTDGFTQLVVPQPAQISINPTAKECPSDGFNYPKFRQLNKQERVQLSTQPYQHQPNVHYVLFAAANSKGWFAAVTLQDDRTHSLVFSPLADLRAAFKSAKAGNGTFAPQRTTQVNSQKPTIIAFANSDTRLFVAFEAGELLVYDTAVLFSAGNDPVNPIYALPPIRGPIRVLAPNPGPEPNLLDFLAVVHSDNTVVLYNMKLEAQGGWNSTPGNAPVAIAWSPKGKHIAIGLQSGDIMTYPLTNKSSIHKHIPPTHQSPLASLDWLTPGHTFRTSYGGPGTDPVQHIICVDSKIPTATYYAPNFPFPASDRSNQSYILALQKWDEEAGAIESKSLVVVADKASVDIEILGNIGTQWYQESQENPLSLPLNNDQGDTLLLGLAVDLTDEQAGEPVMYAYLDDGTVQAWHLEHSKPYSGMITSQVVTAAAPTPTPSAFSQPATTMSATAISPPSQAPSAFGQPSTFGQTSTVTSAFGKPSAFGAQAAPAFGTTGFGQNTTSSAFGQPSPFGQASSSSAFGTPLAFGQTSQPTNAFSSLQTQSSPFGQPANPSAFGAGSGAFGGGSFSAFSGGSSGAFGGESSSGSAFGGSTVGGNTSSNVFGGPSFGAAAAPNTFGGTSFSTPANNNTSVHNVFGQGSFGMSSSSSSAPAPQMTREESVSMSDDTPSLGGMGLGAPNDPSQPAKSGGIFGSFAASAAPSTTQTSAFGVIKPASGAFSNFTTNTTPATDQKAITEPAPASAFGNTTKPASGFGQSSFGQPSFGGSSFGQQAAFGQSSFGKPAAIQPASAVGGGFGAFASSSPSSFAAVAKQSGTPISGGFGAFASSASPFGSAPALPASGSFAAAAGNEVFGTGSAFATSGFAASPVAKSPSEKEIKILESPPTKVSVKPTILADSPPSSPDATPRLGKASVDDKSPTLSTDNVSTTPAFSPFGKAAGSTPGAFANLMTTPSVFKPATGFGAFGSDKIATSSPFFNAGAGTKGPLTSGLPTALAGTPSSTGALSTSASPAFGSSSALGAARSVFPVVSAGSPTPVNAPATGGFGAFSGASAGFGAFSGPKMSFDELLKVGDNDSKDLVKSSTNTSAEAEKPKPVSVFPVINKDISAPLTPPKELLKGEDSLSSPLDDKKGKGVEKGDLSDETSFGNLSTISVGSSFTEVNDEESNERDVHSGSEDAEEEQDGFLSDDLEVEEGEIEDEEDEESSESEEEPSQLSDVPEEDEEEEEEEGSKDKDAVFEPTSVPLPQSRSPSLTPQPEVPKVKVTPSPPPETLPQKAQDGSTTPPGTPPKEVTPPPVRPAPVSAPSSTPSTPFGLSLGRPSTRPTRSSPLASSAVSLSDDDEAPSSPAKPLVSPQPRIEALPTKDEANDDATSSSKPPRPRTPPLLSAFGSSKPAAIPATPATPITPTITAAQPSTANSAPSTPLPTFGLFGKSNAAPQTIIGVAPVSSSSGLLGNLTAKTETPSLQPPMLNQAPGPVAGPSAPSSFFGKTFSLPGATDKGKGKESNQSDPSLSGPLPQSGKTNESIPTAMPPPIDLSALKGKPITPATSPVVSAPFNLSGFSLKPSASAASAATATANALSTPVSSPVLATPEKSPVNVPTEAGLQRECMLVYGAVNEDLAALGIIAEQRTKGLGTIQARGNMPRTRADFADPREWSPASALQFGRILLQFEKDLDELHDIRIAQRTQLKEIQSNVLKARTRKEEIGRFNRAKDDKEFAKMLKARSLGPEHLETQAQLRRAIRVIRDRVQTLEDHLKGSKKKLTQVKTGRPSIRPPTLDSINRTYRNIDLALNQQAAKIALLKKRFAKLRTSSQSIPDPSSPYLKRDPRLPSPQANRRSAVTPDVAATTAAALNAERAAHRLKRALLQARPAPLLNITASLTPAPPLSFNTPQKEVRPTWTPPERRGATGAKKHGVIPFAKKTGSPGSHGSPFSGSGSTASPSFDWGPLPSFDYEKRGNSIAITPITPLRR